MAEKRQQNATIKGVGIMGCMSSTCRRARALLAALALLAGAVTALGADTFTLSDRQSTIPAVAIGAATYSDMVVTIGVVVVAMKGIYGTLGNPSAATLPGARDSGAVWVDVLGHYFP